VYVPSGVLQELANIAVKEFETAIQSVTVANLAAICGAGTQSTASLASEVVFRLARLIAASLGVLNVLACKTIVPLYVRILLNVSATNRLTLMPIDNS
jgi:hypothetical protein